MKEKPAASARPSAWLAIPALPSCKTQVTGDTASTAAIDGKAMRSFTKTTREEQADETAAQQNCAYAGRCL